MLLQSRSLDELKDYLPLLIPLIIVQFILLTWAIVHIFRHKTYKRGSRALWLAVVIIGMEYIGPILYFVLGKEED